MEEDLTRPVIPRLSFISAVELTPRTGPVDASDIKKNLYGDFSSISNISQRESLESKEGIHVSLRIKPFMQSEKENVSQECISVLDPTSVILNAPQSSKVFRLSEKNMGQLVQKFTFSQVFGPETTQEELFEGSVKQPVLDFIKGHSRLVFTYGVTNAGKTYTYQGTEEASGLLPRALNLLFKRIQSRLYPEVDLKPHRCREHRKLSKEEAREEVSVKNSLLRLMREVDYPSDIDENHSRTADSSKDFQELETEAVQSNMEEDRRALFSVWVSFCEIYNECIYDLLLPLSSDKRRKVLRLAQDIKGCSYVKDLQWIQVSNFKEAFKLMKLGLKHQSFASTKLNANSSRSHSIFTVKMLRIDSEATRVMQVNELFLCDLAGSERCTRTHNEGNRLKESGNINNSLLILGKCINALKTTQQSKLQQHIPFRESKLTHFFQGFFSGKGKVMVLDSPNSPPKETFDQVSVNAEYEGNTEESVCLPIKRATILWERTLEDVMEDEEELVEESNGVHEANSIAENILRLLQIIEELKTKLIDERKDKLLLELKIREEVTQEFTQYYNEKENDLNHSQEMMEENCEKRMEIYKDLVKECTQLSNGEKAEKGQVTQTNVQDRTQGDEAEELADDSNLSCMVEAMQQNVSDIKQQAAMAYRAIDALEEPQTTIERLEKQLAEKMALQNKRIQELSEVVEQKDDEIRRLQVLINQMEAVIKISENTIIAIKHEMGHEYPNKLSCTDSGESLEKYAGIGRKRCIESQEEEDGPPAKQGSVNSSATDTIEAKKPEEMQPHTLKEKGEMVALEEKNKLLEIQLVTLREELEKEKKKNEGFSRKIASLSQELSTLEEKASDLSRELQQQQVNCETMTSKLVALKDTNKNQGEQIQKLLGEMEAASQTIAEQKTNGKAVEVKIGELSRLGSQCLTTRIDVASPKRVVGLPKEGEEETHGNCGQRSSFHCSIESIWEVSKQIIHASSQKSSQIENLLQQVEELQRRAQDIEDEKCKLKVEMTETTNQLHTSLQEKECLIKQLKDLQEENALYVEKYREEEKKALGYLEQLKNKDGLIEEDRAAKEAKITFLEQTLREKESAILAMEREAKDLHEKLNVSESKVRRLDDQESQLKAEVLELRRKLRTAELQEKDKEEAKQMTEQLNSKLSESVALSSHLRMEIQQKDEEYADLKEKLTDAKKQIEQVQREVCSMRAEGKSLRNKVNELEKAKKQLTEELDVKQRTIQQFNKEELNKKLEDIRHQYQKACEDICHKDKIIKDMKLTLEEQEQTQSEQDQVLEARLEENEKCVSELEEWKKKYHELEKQSGSLGQQNGKAECEKSMVLLSEELGRLQEKLKECEEQHKIDRKKWLTEKMLLISQAKEAETHRNREMKKFAENREHHTKQLIEAERLVAEKDNDLQKWRTERDQLVAALEVQLSTLVSSNAQKDKEIEELKKIVLKASGKDFKTATEELSDDSTKELKRTCENFTSTLSSIRKGVEKNTVEDLSSCKQPLISPFYIILLLPQDQSDSILDSCEVSSENNQTSRFPKPEMEIQFTPLQPNKMEVKHQGSPSSVTIKVPKARKRKSSALDEDLLKNENEKNAASPADVIINSNSLCEQNNKSATDHCVRKDYSLRSKHYASKVTSPGDTGGTLQKFGSFLQSSPTIIQSKAKKLMATIKSPKPTEEVSLKEVKPKKAKRKLYSTDISSPMDFSGHVIVMDQKESDHEIIKRRLRTKKTR
ncbi:hypothetical protein JD844_006518 [Phrynosoma platyrhinos]|uniref:Kinesin motor domain-containing protein n=1 Tax=Phrynosoma platyrhinos TaxID=52577 RepID=A0ABQ7T1X7_PHRPL|nr:hypothetical protein JD844_006518 [Phrynosoma platyrhinos]